MKGIHQTLPKARKSQLIIKEVEDELLVYDLNNDKAHCLNTTAAMVWNHCDGQTTVAKMARLLEGEMKAAVGDEIVWFALEQLRKSHLLEEPFVAPPQLEQMSRRALIKRLGVAAAVTVPFIMSITAPTAAQTATCRASGSICTSDSQCCSNSCQDNGRGILECA